MLANILFKPIGLILGLIVAKKVGNKTFDGAYEKRYGTKAPTALTEQADFPHVALAAAARASIVAVTAVTFNRTAAKGFRYITGFWPGEERPEPAARLDPSSK